jgi:hypothetical protein
MELVTLQNIPVYFLYSSLCVWLSALTGNLRSVLFLRSSGKIMKSWRLLPIVLQLFKYSLDLMCTRPSFTVTKFSALPSFELYSWRFHYTVFCVFIFGVVPTLKCLLLALPIGTITVPFCESCRWCSNRNWARRICKEASVTHFTVLSWRRLEKLRNTTNVCVF